MTLIATLAPLQGVVFALVALGAPVVVLTRDPLRQALVNGIYGVSLTLALVAIVVLVVMTVVRPREEGVH